MTQKGHAYIYFANDQLTINLKLYRVERGYWTTHNLLFIEDYFKNIQHEKHFSSSSNAINVIFNP